MIKEVKKEVNPLIHKLESHSLYADIQSIEGLRLFMERHVYAVLDFMSLLSSLRRTLLPNDTLWRPREDNDVTRFLNEISLGEESDQVPDGRTLSHFELYLEAMEEVGASTEMIREFVEVAKQQGVGSAMNSLDVPSSSRFFTLETFKLIEENAVHKIAASFCFGREQSIPLMFQGVLDRIGVTAEAAPKFYFYVKRHIEIDGEDHGPMSEKLLQLLCGNDSQKWAEAKSAAIHALNMRDIFWGLVQKELRSDLLNHS